MWNTQAEFMYCGIEKPSSKIRKHTSKLHGMLLQFLWRTLCKTLAEKN
jgi:hypothetical protein